MHAEKTIRSRSAWRFLCFAEPVGRLPPHAVECDSLTTASIGYLRPLQAQSFHSPQLPVSAESAAPVVVAPGHSDLANVELHPSTSNSRSCQIPERLRSARHQMVLTRKSIAEEAMQTLRRIIGGDDGCWRTLDPTASQLGARPIAGVCTSKITRSGRSPELRTQPGVVHASHRHPCFTTRAVSQMSLRLTASGSDTKTRIGQRVSRCSRFTFTYFEKRAQWTLFKPCLRVK